MFRVLFAIPVAIFGVPAAFAAAAIQEILPAKLDFEGAVYDGVNRAGRAATNAGRNADDAVKKAIAKSQCKPS